MLAGLRAMVTGWGSTPEERAAEYPCDRALPASRRKTHSYFRAVSIAAPRSIVFRWLCQLRVAPYAYDWLDNLGRQSPRQLTPGLEKLELGQRVMGFFDIVSFEPDRHITTLARPSISWAMGQTAVTYFVKDEARGAGAQSALRGSAREPDQAAEGGAPEVAGTRLIMKIAIQYPAAPLGWFTHLILPTGDLITARRQLLNMKLLSEAQARTSAR